MASPIALGAAMTRLASHFRVSRTEAELAIVSADWKTGLDRFPDEILSRAVDSWIIAYDRHPTLSQMMDACLEELRLIARQRYESGRRGRVEIPAGRIANPHVARKAIHVARIMKLPPAQTWAEMEVRAAMDVSALESVEEFLPRRGSTDPAGHDHSKDREGCALCSRHDHSSPLWREECPECGGPIPELYEWSVCSSCDGSGWVPVDHPYGPVRPCLVCNEDLHALWEGGHFVPNHRCDVCAPSKRKSRDDRPDVRS